MHYLIDGHNLIAKMPNIELGEENDEAKLVLALKGWAAGSPKRRVTVYFDGGLPGGLSLDLSSGPVTAVFAPSGRSADNLLMRAIRGVKNPPEYMLVSSDQKIVHAARRRKMAYALSEAFARQMTQDREERLRPSAPVEEPSVSPEEVAEWLERFGPIVESPPPPAIPAPAGALPAAPSPKRSAAELKTSGAKLRPDEVSEWLDIFGPAPTRPGKPVSPARPTAKARRPAPNLPTTHLKSGDNPLNDDEVNEWLNLFARPGHSTPDS